MDNSAGTPLGELRALPRPGWISGRGREGKNGGNLKGRDRKGRERERERKGK